MNTVVQHARTLDRPMTYRVSLSWKMALESMGIDVDALTVKANLPSKLFDRTDISLTEMEYLNLWGAFYNLVTDDSFCIDFTNTVFDKSLNALTFTAICKDNFLHSLELIRTYRRLISPMRYEPVIKGDRLFVYIKPPESTPDVHYSLYFSHFASCIETIRRGLQRSIRPVSVTAEQLPQPTRTFEKYFGTSITLGEGYCLEFTLEDAKQTFVSKNSKIAEFTEQALDLRIKQLGGDCRFANLTRTALFKILPTGESSIDVVAQLLHVGGRSLQRRLQEEGTSYREVLLMVRGELAIHYLTQTKRSPKEIGALLAYDDPTSFYRAYHKWTGITPETTRNFMPKQNYQPT